mgnify:CR=1 FL=1
MADSDEPRGEEQDNQAKIERLSEEVDRLWSRDMAQIGRASCRERV